MAKRARKGRKEDEPPASRKKRETQATKRKRLDAERDKQDAERDRQMQQLSAIVAQLAQAQSAAKKAP